MTPIIFIYLNQIFCLKEVSMAKRKAKVSKNAKITEIKPAKPLQIKDHHGTRNFLFALIIILALIAAFLIFLNLPKTQEVKEPIMIKQQTTQQTEPKTTQTIIQTTQGKITSDYNKQKILDEIKTCTEQIEQETQFTKQLIEAINTKDPTKCQGFETFCEAKINKDTNICNQLQEKEFCQAIILEEKTLCKQDTTCLAFTTKNKQLCTEMQDTDKISCELMATKDIKNFERQKSMLKIKCSDQAYKKYAFLYEIQQLCDNIVDEDLKQECR